MPTSSAVPADLIEYSRVTTQLDDELRHVTLAHLAPTLAEFWLSRPDISLGLSELNVVEGLLGLASSAADVDGWVGRVGQAFERAGSEGSVATEVIALDDAALAAALSEGGVGAQPPGCTGGCGQLDHWYPFPDEPLFNGDPSPDDVEQYQIGDCYFASSVAAWAEKHPSEVRNMITDNHDGTYTVHFREKLFGLFWHDVDVTVDGYLPVDKNNHPIYSQLPDGGATWYPILEKAYAKWKGGYTDIGNGGYPADALSAITGNDTDSIDVSSKSAEDTFNAVRDAVDGGRPITATTYGQGPQYTGSRVVPDHAYTILGYSWDEHGNPTIELRNPWGSDSQEGNRYHGDFWLTVDEFQKYYQAVTWAKT